MDGLSKESGVVTELANADEVSIGSMATRVREQMGLVVNELGASRQNIYPMPTLLDGNNENENTKFKVLDPQDRKMVRMIKVEEELEEYEESVKGRIVTKTRKTGRFNISAEAAIVFISSTRIVKPEVKLQKVIRDNITSETPDRIIREGLKEAYIGLKKCTAEDVRAQAFPEVKEILST